MFDVRLIISDASYSYERSSAAAGIVDLSSGRKYTIPMYNVSSPTDAEYRSLALAVQIALKYCYQNVVFIYDCKAIKKVYFEEYLRDKMNSVQFLWLPREFVHEADKLAKNGRKSLEKLYIANKKDTKILTNNNIIHIFRQYSQTSIIKAFMKVANSDERAILKTYLANEKYPPVLVSKESLEFFRDIYNMLSGKSKNKKKQSAKFAKYIDKNYPDILDMYWFKQNRPTEDLRNVIKNLIFKLTVAHNKSSSFHIEFNLPLAA